MAFAIPTTQAAFERHLRLQRHFASMTMYWGKYWIHVGSVFRSVEPVYRQLGVSVREEVTLAQFGELFSGEFDAIILFAHWRHGAVEFEDGFADVPSIVAKVPFHFDGLLDLCVCHPESLVTALKLERPNLWTKSLSRERTTPRVWLYFYLALFTYLRDDNITYLKGLEVALREITRRVEN